MDIMERIKEVVEGNSIVLFMKGSPDFPQCGFSMRASQAVTECGKEYKHVDVLADPEVRSNLVRYADWPTFPQLFINGELVGGCDIIMEMYENGDLKTMIDQA
ncbi:MAG: monothiol glutaredoxin, Grx4 family [Gammaproteobacteria bacterium]|nr:MAG: monothiol glutaredoxin, Grx4 family [Gammaproteobacteria bacterium]